MSLPAHESPIETNQFQKYIHVSKYSRWLEEEKRRETWFETVSRYMNHMDAHLITNNNYKMDLDLYDKLFAAIYNGDVMPSMRALMTAGPALTRSGIAAYNCSYLPIDHPRAFDEILYILAHGSGVGFSVEKKYTDELPEVPNLTDVTIHRIVVGDSKEGWATALRDLIECLYAGIIPTWDVSQVREAGAPLKTFGGYASGPEPLVELFNFVIETFKKAQGRKLTPVEVFDIVCFVGRSIVSGGVRRSALICLTDLEDEEMADAKGFGWWDTHPWRELANISVAYEQTPTLDQFTKEWATLYKNKSGERGIFNRNAARDQAIKSGRNPDFDFGTNPCGEIFLRPKGFCNLTEIVVREGDTPASIREKVRLGTILGTFQTTIDNFPYLREEWSQNVKEERLLGVSLTGVFGNKTLSSKDSIIEVLLHDMKMTARETNAEFADELGINRSAAITCIKPSGTVSLLNGTSAGLHPWYSQYYIRSVRGNNVEPMTQYMKDAGIPNEASYGNPNVTVFYFPMKAPDGAVVRESLSALEHLEYWLRFKTYWCEHNPSITIQVKEEEWAEVAAWVANHFDEIGGLSFLPYDTGSYKQAPFEVTDKETYEKLKAQLPVMDWDDLRFYEMYDSMDSARELACSAGACSIIDVGEVKDNASF